MATDTVSDPRALDPESQRLLEDSQRTKNWKRWGPYLSDRQWGTVREDYSATGEAWEYFPHDAARSRTYRWGEDGLLGITDRECRLCLAVALWNEQDPILKERLFGLSGNEGNHGEDVKELYYFLDATPTSSYLEALYKYPQRAFPYSQLLEENRRRGRSAPEYELLDTGIFDGNRYFDVRVEYAKAGPDDLWMRLTLTNRGPEPAPLHVLPTLWFRNTWAWGRKTESYWPRPELIGEEGHVLARHASLGLFCFEPGPTDSGVRPEMLFCDNETNAERLFGAPSRSRWPKDAIHRAVVLGRRDAVNPDQAGTKSAAHYRLELPPGGSTSLRVRLAALEYALAPDSGGSVDALFAERRSEADAFYARHLPAGSTDEERRVARQAWAGLHWCKQYYHYSVAEWLEGDPSGPPAPPGRRDGRNASWSQNLYNRDVLSMPDTWEYPWYAAWDLAFHMVPFCEVDPAFAKEQLILLLREWYMHANGHLPAYEWAFSDVNPPVHAWACWRVYKKTGPRGRRDVAFLKRVFHKLLLNFTWWVNRKDPDGRNLFSGGFLGLDNIGVFDRSKPLPSGGQLTQADGTAWMAFFCTTMLSMALELAQVEEAYQDIASKFFEHFVAIVDAMNAMGGRGLWDETDGFYYDHLVLDGRCIPLRIRSLVGIIPLFATEVLGDREVDRLPGFNKRMRWFLENRPELAMHLFYRPPGNGSPGARLLAMAPRERLLRLLSYVLDENEFLSPHGIRSLSRVHEAHPYVLAGHSDWTVRYDPGDSTTGIFGGNSNWRGPVWFPLNYLLIEALERYHHFYGDAFQVECPTGSKRYLPLAEVAHMLSARLLALFLPDPRGRRPAHGGEARYATDPAFRDLVLFYEYFHGDTGRGLGANHQTGWTALVLEALRDVCEVRGRGR
ncbi:MAG: glucosidase [Myxococcaceae bacterium]|nr:MAG: glucosidase [Myxococcaceae bacterium]